ncbi:MAG: phenylacetate--CoA ligase family protein [bacterium]|nr:phenylacetate--CoA ligase family protein [bacterium]
MPARLARGLYFFLQRLRREPVVAALRDVRASELLGRDELRALQAERLLSLLRFAVDRVPFYREELAPYRAEINRARSWDDAARLMSRLPILEKTTVRQESERLLALGGRQLSTFPDRTSGSTGTPLQFPCDRRAWAYRHALLFRTLEAFGIEVGEPYAYFFGLHWRWRLRMSTLLRDQVFNRVRVSAFDIGPSQVEGHWRELQRWRPTHFHGYPAAIHEFCVLCRDHGLDLEELELKAVALTGEPTYGFQRELIEATTGAPCVDFYGSAEGGLDTFECPAGSLHLTSEATWLELRQPEETTGEVLVTDLFLRAFPLIRYAVGDEITLRPGRCSCGRSHPMVASLDGRSGEPVRLPNGRIINSHMPGYVFKPLASQGLIRRYRFLETEHKGLDLLLLVSRRFSGEHLQQVERETRTAFGEDFPLTIRIVDEMPALPGGKHRDYLSLARQGIDSRNDA